MQLSYPEGYACCLGNFGYNLVCQAKILHSLFLLIALQPFTQTNLHVSIPLTLSYDLVVTGPSPGQPAKNLPS